MEKKKNRYNYHNVKKKSIKNSTNHQKKVEEKVAEEFSEDEEIISSEDEIELQHKNDDDKLQKFLKREKKEHDEYFREIKRNRVDQLKQANEEEDKVIAKYEKLLKLNRRKKGAKCDGSSIGKFNDGLDYLLELCTEDNIKKMYDAAKEAYDDEPMHKTKKRKVKAQSDSENETEEVKDLKFKSEKLKKIEEKYFGDDDAFFINQNSDDNNDSCDGEDSELESDAISVEDNNALSEDEMESSDQGDNDEEDESNEEVKEDIYGRKRDKEGNVVHEPSKYVPPHMRRNVSVINYWRFSN